MSSAASSTTTACGAWAASATKRPIVAGIESVPANVEDPETWLEELHEERLEEAEEESNAFDIAWAQYARYLREQGQPVPPMYRGLVPEALIEASLTGLLPVDQRRRFGSSGAAITAPSRR